MFLVSLAVADMTVAIFVLPFNVTVNILERWPLGEVICKAWLTSDVMCCTASMLHLCAIAIDRYRAIHDPINYVHKRTAQRMVLMICAIWSLSAIVASPPLLGWNNWPRTWTDETVCELSTDLGYVLYSAVAAFFIPLVIMSILYVKIYYAIKERIRAKASRSMFSVVMSRGESSFLHAIVILRHCRLTTLR